VDEPRRLYRRAVWCEEATNESLGIRKSGITLGERRDIGGIKSVVMPFIDVVLDSLELGSVTSERHPPLRAEVGIDKGLATKIPNASNRVDERCREPNCLATIGQFLDPTHRDRRNGRAPTTVSAGRAETYLVGVYDHDPQLRVICEEVERGPEAGVSRTHDEDINGGVGGERESFAHVGIIDVPNRIAGCIINANHLHTVEEICC
jgi:hypothetical protein